MNCFSFTLYDIQHGPALGAILLLTPMRPALTRLLKRPSALSIIDSLAASSIGIEQLDSRHTRLQCYSRCTKKSQSIEESGHGPLTDEKTKPLWQPKPKKKQPTLAVYDIELAHDHKPDEVSPRARGSPANTLADTKLQKLRLDPERLEFESDIGHTDKLGSRLVDLPENRNNFELWEELLRFRQRHYGDKGTQAIWEGLTVRVRGVILPFYGDRADFFWRSFLDLGLSREVFLKDVVDYAVTLKDKHFECWPQLYEHVIGGLLERGMGKQAFKWHMKFQASTLWGPRDFEKILPYILSSSNLNPDNNMLLLPGARSTPQPKLPIPVGIKTLKQLCLTIDFPIYGLVIANILERGYGEYALVMHNWLTTHQKHPKSIKEIKPLLEYVRNYGLRKEYDSLRRYAKERFLSSSPGADLSQYLLDSDVTNEQKSKTGFSGERQYKDDLAARLFATRAFNIDVTVGGLRMLGVSKIGPRAIREMAARAHDSQELLANIKSLSKSGISVADSVFTRLVPKLASQNRDFLLADLLQSDQHPDVLEDVKLQESLLISYYMARDWRQYNVSLAILAEHFPDTPDLLDIHFRKHVAAGELGAASKVVDELTLRGRTLSEDSVDFMADKLLPNRRVRHRPQQIKGARDLDNMMYVFKVLQRVVPTGCYVSAAFWKELLQRLGMGDHWDELRECSLWLVRQYVHRPVENDKLRGIFPSHRKSVMPSDSRLLALIFCQKTQQAIVAWGFKFRVTRETESKYALKHPGTDDGLTPWVRGLLLLRDLEQAGLLLNTPSIQSATRTRLTLLFGSYSHSAVRFNRMLRRVNPYSLARVLGDIDLAWGLPLFQEKGYSPGDAPLDKLLNRWRSSRSLRNSAKVMLSRRRAR